MKFKVANFGITSPYDRRIVKKLVEWKKASKTSLKIPADKNVKSIIDRYSRMNTMYEDLGRGYILTKL